MTQHLVDDNLDPYALRDALDRAVGMLRTFRGWMPADQRDRISSEAEVLTRMRDKLRPRAERSGGYWREQVGVGLFREHRVMVVGHDCGWERFVWPDEAKDALELHIREVHPDDPYRHVDGLRASGKMRRSYITTGDADG